MSFLICLANALALITLNYLQLFFFNIIKKAKVSSNFFLHLAIKNKQKRIVKKKNNEQLKLNKKG